MDSNKSLIDMYRINMLNSNQYIHLRPHILELFTNDENGKIIPYNNPNSIVFCRNEKLAKPVPMKRYSYMITI